MKYLPITLLFCSLLFGIMFLYVENDKINEQLEEATQKASFCQENMLNVKQHLIGVQKQIAQTLEVIPNE
jgi:archaellum component FlaC